MTAAEATADGAAFRRALRQFCEVLAVRRLPSLSSLTAELAALPQDAALSPLITRYAAVAANDPQGLAVFRQLSLSWHLSLLRSLVDLVRCVPVAASLPAAAFRPPFDQAGLLLDTMTATVTLDPNGATASLRQLAELGTLRAALARRFSFPLTETWESGGLDRVLTRLDAAARVSRAWGDTAALAAFLRQESDRLRTADNNLVLARTHALAAARALATLRGIAIQLWQEENSRRSLTPDLAESDLELPGGLAVNDLTGSLHWNRVSGQLQGSFGGMLLLPQFSGFLTIAEATLSNTGEFEIDAFGHLEFPPVAQGQPGFVSVDVPEIAPIHLRRTSGGELEFSGSARFTLANGMSFFASASFLEPEYRFSFEVRGIGLKALKALAPQVVPFTGLPGLTPEESLEMWADFYENLGTALEPMDLSGQLPRGVRDGPSAPGLPDEDAAFRAYDTLFIIRGCSTAGLRRRNCGPRSPISSSRSSTNHPRRWRPFSTGSPPEQSMRRPRLRAHRGADP